MKNILIVGGAGYIGSHTAHYLKKKGYNIIIIDDLSKGHSENIKNIKLYKGDFADIELLTKIHLENNIDVIMHFAALSIVPESVKDPYLYYNNNVSKTIQLLNFMKNNNIKNFIFSSTAATFGNPNYVPIDEKHPQIPINPYGWSKLMIERILIDFSNSYNINYGILRYFNAAGAAPDASNGESHYPETHLIPLVLKTAKGIRKSIKIFGTDYNTNDGTCIRDYIHIYDLAKAHYLTMKKVIQNNNCIYNLGNGKGYSVKQIINSVKKITGIEFKVELAERRAGDPDILIASSDKITKELGFKPEYDNIETIIEHAWNWEKKI